MTFEASHSQNLLPKSEKAKPNPEDDMLYVLEEASGLRESPSPHDYDIKDIPERVQNLSECSC